MNKRNSLSLITPPYRIQDHACKSQQIVCHKKKPCMQVKTSIIVCGTTEVGFTFLVLFTPGK